MIKVKSIEARKILSVEIEEEILEFLKKSAEYFGPADWVGYEGKNEEKIKARLEQWQSKQD